jgi:hypothetical protein
MNSLTSSESISSTHTVCGAAQPSWMERLLINFKGARGGSESSWSPRMGEDADDVEAEAEDVSTESWSTPGVGGACGSNSEGSRPGGTAGSCEGLSLMFVIDMSCRVVYRASGGEVD